ncbi:YHYH protein [Verrucomicrobiales bacterium]|nr:YHYH protein [Verrucomicrobiales bacterium]
MTVFQGIGVVLSISLLAQGPGDIPEGPGGGGPGGRKHTANEAAPLNLIPATEWTPERNKVKIRKRSDEITIEANGMPDHRVGQFSNPQNPNEIAEQRHDIVIPADPKPAATITHIHGGGPGSPKVFGITLDGVLIEPGTAETWMGDRQSGWNYEALGGAVPLGLDTNFGHVQPTGLYHYHGIPTGLLQRLKARKGEHSPMIGWAADGFPIYAVYGYSDPKKPNSPIVELTTSYQLKTGERPAQTENPAGKYDGAFVQDYEFEEKLGTLDDSNGRFCVTPEFPDGTYAYFMTRDWPVIPRAFRGTPIELKPMGPPHGGKGPPPGGKGLPLGGGKGGKGPPPGGKGGKGFGPPR